MAELNDLTTTNQTNNPRWTEGVQLIPQLNDSARELEAIIARGYRDMRGSLAATGGPVAYALSTAQTVSVLFDGFRVSFQCPATCNANPTLNVNGTGARALVVRNDTPLLGFDMISGAVYDAISVGNQWLVLNPTLVRRRESLRMQPGNANVLDLEAFSEASTGDFFRMQGHGHNAAASTVKYGEYRVGVRDPATGFEEGRLLGTVIQDAVEQTMFQFEGNRAAFLGASLREENTIALPTGARIFAGTTDLGLGSGGPQRAVRFSVTGNFAKQANSSAVIAIAVGGGGGGGRSSSGSILAGAGGSGGVAMSVIPSADLPASALVTVGAGGAAGGTGVNGVNGQTTIFQGISAFGGIGGSAGGGGGGAGSASGGQVNVTGTNGQNGGVSYSSNPLNTFGGTSPFFGLGQGGQGGASAKIATAGANGGVIILEF